MRRDTDPASKRCGGLSGVRRRDENSAALRFRPPRGKVAGACFGHYIVPEQWLLHARAANQTWGDVMDAKEKIKKASAILDKYEVGKNISFLIDDACRHGVEGVEWDAAAKASLIPNCYKLYRFTYGGRRFQIAAMNNRLTVHGDEHWSDLTLTIDGEVVLGTVLSAPVKVDWAVHQVNTDMLTQVKLGDWMKDLAEICVRSRRAAAELKRRADERKAATLASEIDLGEYE